MGKNWWSMVVMEYLLTTVKSYRLVDLSIRFFLPGLKHTMVMIKTIFLTLKKPQSCLPSEILLGNRKEK